MTTGHADVVGLWRAEMKHRKSERYIAQVEAIIARLVEHAGVPIEQVGRDHVSLWLSDLCDKTTARTANNNLAAFRGFARWGVRAEVMPRDPTEGVEPYRAVRREGRAFTVNEVVGLIRAAAEDESRPRAECRHHDGSPVMRSALYRFLALTGMRAGEAQVLRWRDWEFDATPPVVALQPGLTRKGHAGRRVVLDPSDAAWFRAYAGRADMGDLCFERPAWGVIQRDLRAAGIPQADRYGRTAGLHAFRRYVGTALAQAGLSPKVAQARLGHSSITTTLRHYTDLGDGEEAAAVLSLEGCPAEKSYAPLSVAGPETYQHGMRNLQPHSGKVLDLMGESADHVGMVMRTGQHRPPDTGEHRVHRFESCIAHSLPQDSGGFPEQLNTDTNVPLWDGGVMEVPCERSLSTSSIASSFRTAQASQPIKRFMLSQEQQPMPALEQLHGWTGSHRAIPTTTTTSPSIPCWTLMPLGSRWSWTSTWLCLNTDRTPSDGGNVWPHATGGDSLAAGGFLSAPDARVATLGVGLDSPSATDGAQLIPLGGGWKAPSSGFALLSSLSILGGGTTISLPGFRPAVGQAAGRDSDCHLLSEGKTHPTRSCGLSRSQLVAMLRASDDVREAVAALMEDDLWK